MRALKIAASGMLAQQMRVETISNNLANMNTTGYNARRAEFADLHYQQMARPGTISASDGTVLPAGVQLGLGVRPTAVTMQLSQGALSATGGDLDVAIEGGGFIEVRLPSGISAYTRDGALHRSPDGVIVTADGHPVVPDITLPQDLRSVAINADGEVWGQFADRVEPELLGQITLAGFTNPKGLEADRRQPLHREHRLWPAAGRRAGRGRPRHAAPGLPGGQLGRLGARDHRTDRGPARLRAQRQGHHRGRPDARRGGAGPMRGLAAIALAGAALLAPPAALPAAADTPVAARTLRAQSVLTGSDLAFVPEDVPGAILDPAAIVGMETRVALYAGRPIRPGDIGPPALVDRNQTVQLVYRTAGLAILAEGRAMERGGAGDGVRVMNLDSRTIVRGTVLARRHRGRPPLTSRTEPPPCASCPSSS